jgi:translation initiation factor 3 subunit B
VQLSGGTSWAEEGLHRFLHANVKLVDISPCEKYIVTWSPDPIISTGNSSDPRQFTGEDEGNHIVIWEIKTGNILRTFPQVLHDAAPDTDGKKQMAWPAFKWSPDDKYTARIIPGQQISVYELPGMGLLEKKSIKVEGVVDFSWDPIDGHRKAEFVDGEKETKRATEHILAYWTPEISNQPARVTLLAIPSRTVLRSKNLFNVSHVRAWTSEALCSSLNDSTKPVHLVLA